LSDRLLVSTRPGRTVVVVECRDEERGGE
jgi:hypothetical protein